ncbi:transposable element Tcb1 transposase [Trichonephila clavipes]|nr:transposable element Tcb1 transposase [Trichonephila clavipes]
MTIVFVCGDPVVNASILPLLYSDIPLPQMLQWYGGAIAYNTRSLVVFIRGIVTAQRYDHDILQPHVFPLMQRLSGSIFYKKMLGLTRQGCHKNVSALLLPFLGLPDPQIPRPCLQSSISGIIWDDEVASYEFERTRGKVTANMERNVSRHHTELVCLNARLYCIMHSR